MGCAFLEAWTPGPSEVLMHCAAFTQALPTVMVGACEAQQGWDNPETSGMRPLAHPLPASSERRLTVPSPRPWLASLGGGGTDALKRSTSYT